LIASLSLFEETWLRNKVRMKHTIMGAAIFVLEIMTVDYHDTSVRKSDALDASVLAYLAIYVYVIDSFA
jgi:hypothetical protein